MNSKKFPVLGKLNRTGKMYVLVSVMTHSQGWAHSMPIIVAIVTDTITCAADLTNSRSAPRLCFPSLINAAVIGKVAFWPVT
jgi:hypothetical protein